MFRFFHELIHHNNSSDFRQDYVLFRSIQKSLPLSSWFWSFLSPAAPDIIKYPKEETVVHIPKTSVVLPCRAEGYPKPKISWVKSDAMLQFDNNVFMAHDGSLVILSMQYENEGIYSCVAGNIFGKKVVTQKLYLGQGMSTSHASLSKASSHLEDLWFINIYRFISLSKAPLVTFIFIDISTVFVFRFNVSAIMSERCWLLYCKVWVPMPTWLQWSSMRNT